MQKVAKGMLKLLSSWESFQTAAKVSSGQKFLSKPSASVKTLSKINYTMKKSKKKKIK